MSKYNPLHALFIYFIITFTSGCTSEPKSETGNSSSSVDSTAPLINISSPTNNEIVGTNFTVTGNVSDNSSGIDGVEIYVSPKDLSYTNIFPVLRGISIYSSIINMTNFGDFLIWAKAADRAGNTAFSPGIAVNIANLPLLNFISPGASGQVLLTNKNIILFSGTASVNNANISGIKLISYTAASLNALTNDAAGTTNWAVYLTLVQNATNIVEAFATADNGKISRVQSIMIIIDISAPDIFLSSPTNNQECLTNFTVTSVLSDEMSGISNAVLHISPTNLSYTDNCSFSQSFSTNITVDQYGSYFLWIDAADFTGNISNINKILINIRNTPVINIISPATSGFILTNTNLITISGTSGVNGGIITGLKVLVTTNLSQTNITNDAYGLTNWSYNAYLTGNMTNWFYAYASSDNGSISPVRSIAIIADLAPPVITISSLSNNQLTGNAYSFSGTANDILSGVNRVFVKLDNGFFSQVTVIGGLWQTNLTVTNIGKHTNYIFAEDSMGNISETDSVVIEYTDEFPSVIITNLPDELITNATSVDIGGMVNIGIFFTITDVEVIKNGFLQYASLSPDKTSWLKENLYLTPNTTNTIIAMAVGSSGKTNFSSTNRLIVDTISPVLTGILPANNSTISGSYTFQGSVSDNFTGVDKVWIKLDNSGFSQITPSGNSWLQNYSVAAGWHTNYVYATDKAGNTSAIFTNIVLFQPSAPSVSIISPSNYTTTNAEHIDLYGTAATVSPFNISKVELSVNGGSFFDTEAEYGTAINWTASNLQILVNQTNIITARVVNNCGQTNYSGALNIIADVSPPSVNLDKLPPYTNKGSFTVTASVNDDLAGVKTQHYTTDNGTDNIFTNSAFPVTLSSDGQHTVSVWAIDRANNTSITQTLTTYVDTTPPVLGFTSPVGGQTLTSALLNVQGSAFDSGSGVKDILFAVGSDVFNKVNGVSGWNTNFYLLSGSNYIFKAFAVDNLGNTSLTQTISVRVQSVNNEDMVFIAGGSFTMGYSGFSDAAQTHTVFISNFYIGKYETTFDEWDSYHTSDTNSHNPSDSGWGRGSRPVVDISWKDAIAYCNWKSRQEGLPVAYDTNTGELLDPEGNATLDLPSVKGYRLPTEAEWEYAARALGASPGDQPSGTNTGNETNVAWFTVNSGGKIHPAGEKTANSLGIYDMSGNVSEWCFDWYESSYGSTNAVNPSGPSSGTYKVCRGGSFSSDTDNIKTAYRNGNNLPASRLQNIGVRVVRSE